MKIFKIAFTLFVAFTLFSCGSPNTVTIQAENVSGFNVTNFANLVKTTKDPQALEQAINSPGNSINNLDLNNDGNIDYARVMEVNPTTIQVLDDVSANNTVTVATLSITSQNNTAYVSVNGNPTYCGNNYQYSYHSFLTDFLILSYLTRPHPYYHPAYHYGYYPRWYSTNRHVVRTTTVVNRTVTRPANVSSFNRKSISNPTTSQRQFQVRDNNRPVGTGGFGTKAATPTRSFSQSTRSFGSSRSSFGSRRH